MGRHDAAGRGQHLAVPVRRRPAAPRPRHLAARFRRRGERPGRRVPLAAAHPHPPPGAVGGRRRVPPPGAARTGSPRHPPAGVSRTPLRRGCAGLPAPGLSSREHPACGPPRPPLPGAGPGPGPPAGRTVLRQPPAVGKIPALAAARAAGPGLFPAPGGGHPAGLARAPAGRRIPLRLVYAGRIAREQKRIQDLPVFARALREAGVPFELEVFGDGPDLESLRTAAADLGDRVRIHGSRPQAEILDALGRAHLLLLFSDYEGLPLVLLEAMARSVVPLVTRIRSGVGDLVADGVNARLFDPGQPAAAAAIALELARDPAAFAAMAAAARTTAEAYDLERCLDAYAAHFRPLAARATAGGPARAALRRPAGWKQRLADHLPRRWLEKTP
ncbi:MAG: glycosyltransferase [Kiritimatiellia bacterium]